MENTPWYLNSSTGQGLGLTATGLTLEGITQTIGVILAWSGHPIDSDSLTGVINSIVQAIAAVIVVIGLIRKAKNKIAPPEA